MKSTQPTLGSLIRRLRQHHNWTLSEMSLRTGIPLSTLAKVEHDRLTLSYDKLLQLSERLGMRMSDLFAEPTEEAEPITARRSLGRVDHAVRVKTRNYDYFYLCAELRRKRMIPVLTHIRAKTLSEFGQLVRHSGQEYVHVLTGRVEVHTEFYDPVLLEKDESIYIDSNMGHAYVAAAGCDEAIVLGVCSSTDENLMKSLIELHNDRDAATTPPDATAPVAASSTPSPPAGRAVQRRPRARRT